MEWPIYRNPNQKPDETDPYGKYIWFNRQNNRVYHLRDRILFTHNWNNNLAGTKKEEKTGQKEYSLIVGICIGLQKT